MKVKVGKTGFTLLLLSNNASFIVITSKCLEGILFPSLAYESYRWSFSLCMLMTEAVVWGPLFIYMKKVYTPAVEREPSGLEWRYLWLIPFTFYIIWYHSSFLYKRRGISGVLHRGTAGQRTAEKSAASGK